MRWCDLRAGDTIVRRGKADKFPIGLYTLFEKDGALLVMDLNEGSIEPARVDAWELASDVWELFRVD